MSTARDISNIFAARLAGITQANGFLTDIGARVYRGRRRIDEGMIPCTSMIEGDDNVLAQTINARQRDAKIGQRYIFSAMAECDPDNPNDTAHDILADLKRAIFGGEQYEQMIRSLKYIGRGIEAREDGTGLVAASIEIEVEFAEKLDAP